MEINPSKLRLDIARSQDPRFVAFWADKGMPQLPPPTPSQHEVWVEIGAGSGWFCMELARKYPQHQIIALERSRMRGKRLVARSEKANLPNLHSYRANAIPVVLHGLQPESVDRFYILYPPPWPRNSQRRKRWYVHPLMRSLVRALKPGGLMLWASDQAFYIEEARFVSEREYGLRTLHLGLIAPNAYNDLADFPEGRSKFEYCFLKSNQACYELVSQKEKEV